MTERTATVMDDIGGVGREGMLHLWAAIVSVTVALLLPFVGVVAVYSGYRLSRIMERSWFGLLFAAFGLLHVLSWLLLVAA